jgi:diguanylate cyclase (GGDEF)-like protein/PAS domain S-box-containing protein
VSYPPFAADEGERLAALRRYGLLDTPPQPAFDRIASLAARLFEVPLALITLIDRDRQWLKSCQGPMSATLSVSETHRDIAFCAYTILANDTLVSDDLSLDPRFADNPWVTNEPGVRFYAGAPLLTAEGHALGSLCLIDFQPRTFSAEQRLALADLAAGVVSEIELRQASAMLSEREQLSRQMFENNPHPMWVFDTETLRFLDVNETAIGRYGYTREEFLAMTLADIRLPEDVPRLMKFQPGHKMQPGELSLWRHRKKDDTLIWVEIAAHSLDYHGRAARLVAAHDVTERKQAEDALRGTQEQLQTIIANTPVVLFAINTERIITFSEGKGLQALGLPPGASVGVSVYEYGAEQPAMVAAVERAFSGEATLIMVKIHGIVFETRYSPIFDAEGRVTSVIGVATDVTESRRAEQALHQSEEHLQLALQAGYMGVWDCDLRTGQITGSGNYTHLLGQTPETFGHTFEDFLACVHPEDRDWVTRLGQDALANKAAFEGEYRVIWPDGTVRWLAFKGIFTRDVHGNALRASGAVLDITERKGLEVEREALLAQAEALLSEALERADLDPLTGLLNHRAFHKRLNEAAETALHQEQPLSLLLMDLNNFKFFNDAYGHLAGDGVLHQVTQALLSCARPGDTLARFGGDEFALLLPSAPRAEAIRRAEEIHRAIAQVSYRPPGYDTPIPLSFCLSLAVLPEDGTNPAALLETADTHLRVAKSGGDADDQARHLRRTMAHSVEGFSMLDALVTAVDNKDRYTRKHSEDVMLYSVAIARELGWDDKQLHTVEVAALLHDVGKIGVPDSILRKPGALSREDFQAIQQHPLMGAIIVGAVPGFEETLDAVRHHHERWDGDGYPFGLRGQETPLMARLMAVADAYSAMTTDRPYRKGMDPAKARHILEEGAGTQWDPECVAAFLRAGGIS